MTEAVSNRQDEEGGSSRSTGTTTTGTSRVRKDRNKSDNSSSGKSKKSGVKGLFPAVPSRDDNVNINRAEKEEE